MSSLKSSFWGNISYVGMKRQHASKIIVAIASHEFCIRIDDPALKYLRVSSGSTKPLVIIEQISLNDEGIYRVYAFFKSIGLREARVIQGLLQQQTSSSNYLAYKDGTTQLDRDIADWCPTYQVVHVKKSI